MTIKPSHFQQAILTAVSTTRDTLVVEAVAGSGKSTTLALICKALPTPATAILLAFNTAITKELTERFKRQNIGVRVQGINSAGHGMVCKKLGNVTLDDRKYSDLVGQAIKDAGLKDEDGDIFSGLAGLVKFAMSQLIDTADHAAVLEMAEHFDVDTMGGETEAFMLKQLPLIIEAGVKLAEDRKIIAFIDQLFLPVYWNLRPWQYATVMVDEAQDLSPVQLALVRKLCMKGGRIIAVGDRRQAIYGFAGADASSIQNIVDALKATVLPLSICYRCPRSHVELAKKIVPQIEASETAIEGTIETIKRETFANRVQEGDLVLCRTTAPLVTACFELIAVGMPARIKGKAIGQGLVKLLAKIQKEHGGASMAINEAIEAIYSYQDKAVTALSGQKDADVKADRLSDQINCLIAIFNMGKPTAMGLPSTRDRAATGFYFEIEDLFSDGRPGVTLCTVHRAKGLEEKRVFILEPEKMPHPMAKKPWQREQEYNLKYVAYTRALEALFLIESA
jgi:DNA helicase-2/ATP-dependent DNA helicase PcrA